MAYYTSRQTFEVEKEREERRKRGRGSKKEMPGEGRGRKGREGWDRRVEGKGRLIKW